MSEAARGSEVTDNSGESRYEIAYGKRRAGFAAYRRHADRIVFTHTEIDDEFSGKGLGSVLAAHAVEDANARGLTIVPVCPFIAGWLRKHPEYAESVDWDAVQA